MRIAERGTTLVLLIVLVLVIGHRAEAQTIVLKTGQRVDTTGVRRSGDKVMGKVQIAGTAGEVGHDVSAIAKIEFPEPQGIKRAAEFLSQGDAERALADINPIISFYESFRDLPGSWWAPAAVVKVSALAALQRDVEAEPLAAAIQKIAPDPETARAANLRIASSLVKRKEYDKAAQIVDVAIKESTRADVLADAWVTKGHILLAKNEWDAALLAFLRVPVFYREQRLYMPPAMLGSARAYRRLEDKKRAKQTLNELIATFPKAVEADTAKTELQKL